MELTARREEKRAMVKTRCPNCDSVIKLEKPREGAIIACSACGVELEIVGADPFIVDFVEDWQEGWDDDERDDW